MQFDEALYNQLAALPKMTFRQHRLMVLLTQPPSRARSRVLQVVEAKARESLGVGDEDAVDWGSASLTPINWQQILTFLEAILPQLLALFGL